MLVLLFSSAGEKRDFEGEVNLGRSDTPRADKEGLTKCGELGTYYERKADEVGTKFAKSRKMFDYEGLKKSYEECIGIGFKDVV